MHIISFPFCKCYQHPISCWDMRWVQSLAGWRGKVGIPLPASTLLHGLPKNQEGVVWAVHPKHEDILLRAKQTSLSTLPPPMQNKDSVKLQLWKLIQTALNFNSQLSQVQNPLITTRPMNVRCLEWKQRVKIPVWVFSWKSVIENHLSARQN